MRTILTTTPGRSIVTLEDPVEIRIKGVTQVQITPHGDMTFPVVERGLGGQWWEADRKRQEARKSKNFARPQKQQQTSRLENHRHDQMESDAV